MVMANVSHGDAHLRKNVKCYTVIRDMNKLQYMQKLVAT